MINEERVAVVGGGPSGVAILKNLREAGFTNVTVFEKRSSVGGVWAFSEDAKITSTLKATVSNVSKFGNCFTDFPMPDDFPAHPTAPQTNDYINSYATHFDLHQYIKLDTSVNSIKRNLDDTKWQVSTSTAGVETTAEFDKVVMCSGLTANAIEPRFEGAENYKGRLIHVQAFKRPEDFRDMTVLVLGIGNSAADTSTQLIGHAKKIYLSHRGGVKIVPRMVAGAPLDLVITRQKNLAKFALDRYLPALSRFLFDWTIEQYSRQSFTLDPAWRLAPAPSLANHQPVISDNLVDSLRAGDITSLHGLQRFTGDRKVEFTDGTVLDVDAVILCTGYEPDFTLIDGFSPLAQPSADGQHKAGINEAPLARLYQNLFPPRYSSSLAYMNYVALTDGAITVTDLASMAIAQVWSGAYALPPEVEMEAEIDRHHEWVRALGNGDSVYVGIVRPGPWYAFLNAAAGTHVEENLGYGLEGWRFWWKDRKLASIMMTGVMTPYMYRVFDGRRKKWEGAREAIFHANELAKAFKS